MKIKPGQPVDPAQFQALDAKARTPPLGDKKYSGTTSFDYLLWMPVQGRRNQYYQAPMTRRYYWVKGELTPRREDEFNRQGLETGYE